MAKERNNPPQPKRIRTTGEAPNEDGTWSTGDVRVLVPRREAHSNHRPGYPHVFIDLGQVGGSIEFGLVEARHLHNWLARFIKYAEKRDEKGKEQSLP